MISDKKLPKPVDKLDSRHVSRSDTLLAILADFIILWTSSIFVTY